MEDCREKSQSLLRQLFQFDCADLDFGIYRILNYKRERIEEFLTKDLPEAHDLAQIRTGEHTCRLS